MRDSLGAFCTHCDVVIEGQAGGPLAGLRFAAKDTFDVAGLVCCAGNPDWLRTHRPAASTASAIRMLLEAGATLVGKTQTDELAFSLAGENPHYGTPLNPSAPGRIPGGSSSGSAAAVAGGLVDFALGSDTGGSVRVPASYCGIYGMRPSHGRIPVDGLVPHVPSADTVGWFAREPAILRRVGAVLLGSGSSSSVAARLLIADDAFATAQDEVRRALEPVLGKVGRAVGPVEHVSLSPSGLGQWLAVYTVIQNGGAWASHRAWIEEVRPTFGAAVRERFEAAAAVTPEQLAGARAARERVRERLDAMLRGGAVLCLPTTPAAAPPRGQGAAAGPGRTALLTLTCMAGLAGLPQVNLPLAEAERCPVGLSLIGARGADETLLALAEAIGGGRPSSGRA